LDSTSGTIVTVAVLIADFFFRVYNVVTFVGDTAFIWPLWLSNLASSIE